ncbi:MAG: RNA polymerase sigma factor [Nitrospira sp.]
MSDPFDEVGVTHFPLSCSAVNGPPSTGASRLDSLVEFAKTEHTELLHFLTRRVRCPSAAADLVQELYLRIVTLTRPETIRDPRGFLYTTAKNLAIDYLRKKDRAMSRSEPLEKALTVPIATPDVEAAVDAKRRLAAVLKAIDELPARRRAAFVMFKFEHKTYEEIARELHISVKTVEHHLSKAIAYCRARFEAFDGRL